MYSVLDDKIESLKMIIKTSKLGIKRKDGCTALTIAA